MIKFAPPTKMHLRNLIVTYQQWISAEEEKYAQKPDAPTFAKIKTAKRLIAELRNAKRKGEFDKLPEGI